MTQLGFVENDQRLPRAGAVISPDGFYRYELWRAWDREKPMLGFVMLNPSTADATQDDPTIRRCVKRAANEGFGGIVVQNLYAYRTPSPKLLWDARDYGGVDVIGRENNAYLEGLYFVAPVVVCAWGAGARLDRVVVVVDLLSECDLRCLGRTKDGHPRHPLYVPDAQILERFEAVQA